MSEKVITLSGAATDVIYSLFFRGALQSGDLPSKSGAAELRKLDFAETRHTATEYHKENHFTFLTPKGQEFAVDHLVNTRFGKEPKQQYCCSMMVGVTLDTSAAQKAIDALDVHMRGSDAFKLLCNGEVFINDDTIAGTIHATGSAPIKPQESQNTTVNINTQCSDEALSEAIAKAIKSGLRPGGDIHNAIYKR